jgi:hypothetical protein
MMTVVSPNRNQRMPTEGDAVHLCWDVADMMITRTPDCAQ